MARVASFAERLRELLDRRDLSQAELSRQTGISRSSISHYLRGDWEGKQEVIFALAERFDVSEAWLMGYDAPMDRAIAPLRTEKQRRRLKAFEALPEEAQERALAVGRGVPLNRLDPAVAHEALTLHRSYLRADEHTRQLVDLALKPFRSTEAPWSAARSLTPGEDGFVELDVYEQAAAAGLGNYLDLPVARREQYPAGYVPERANFAVLIAGDSMEPRVHDGGTVFVQSASVVEHGEVGIFVLNGQAYCKQLLINTSRRGAILHSLNPVYGDILLGENDELRTLGRVLGCYPP